MLATDSPSDLIQVLEALYDLEQPRDGWFRGVLKASGTAFDRGAGVGFLLYDVSGELPRIHALEGVNVSMHHFAVGAETHREPAFAKEIVRCYRSVVCATMAEHVHDPQVLGALRERYTQSGIHDQILINGADVSGQGCALYVFSQTLLTLSAYERELMLRIATHFATAYRLQRRLHSPAGSHANGLDAVLNASGKVAHAEPAASSREARRSLTDAVRLREWARGSKGRRDAERATAAWKPLVSGRWSLVDRYERDGTRYITARENVAKPKGPEALSPRERQVVCLASLGHSNKLIAYELGLAHSTVRVLLARGASKLGARTRAELIERARSAKHGWPS